MTSRTRSRILLLVFLLWICYTIVLSVIKVPEDKRISQWHLDVIFHFSSYLVMALLGLSLVSGWALVPVLAIAGGTELLQTRLPWRTGCWSDFGINVAGIVTGLLLWWLAGLLHRRRRLES